VSIEEIADAAGISRRTFFRYFESRDDLLAATPARSMIRAMRSVRDRPARESIVDALLATARETPRSEHESEIMRLSAQVMARSPGAWTRALGPLRRATDPLFSETVAHRLRGAGRSDAGADVIGAAIAAVVVRVYCDWVAAGCAGGFADRLQEGFRQLAGVFAPAKQRGA
jgi:AcrR family transcriptional regulator